MPVPDFSPGEVLTAAAMDSIGMWLVKTQTIGTGVSSVTMTGVFSANYENYKIVVSGGIVSIGTNYRMYLGGGSNGNYYGTQYFDLASGGGTGVNRVNAGNSWYIGAVASTISGQLSLEMSNPFVASRTSFSGTYAGNNYVGWSGGQLADATQYTSLTIIADGATMTGGIIRVYGYRN